MAGVGDVVFYVFLSYLFILALIIMRKCIEGGFIPLPSGVFPFCLGGPFRPSHFAILPEEEVRSRRPMKYRHGFCNSDLQNNPIKKLIYIKPKLYIFIARAFENH